MNFTKLVHSNFFFFFVCFQICTTYQKSYLILFCEECLISKIYSSSSVGCSFIRIYPSIFRQMSLSLAMLQAFSMVLNHDCDVIQQISFDLLGCYFQRKPYVLFEPCVKILDSCLTNYCTRDQCQSLFKKCNFPPSGIITCTTFFLKYITIRFANEHQIEFK